MGDVVMEIYPPETGQNQVDFAAPMLGFRVHSLEETLEKLRVVSAQASGEIKISEWGRWCNVLDFDGRIIQLVENER